jgi:hypothetical protein
MQPPYFNYGYSDYSMMNKGTLPSQTIIIWDGLPHHVKTRWCTLSISEKSTELVATERNMKFEQDLLMTD